MRGCAVLYTLGMAALMAVVSIAPVAHGQDDAMPPGVLPAEEAEAGWINLFDKETTFGWNAIGDAEWTVVDGVLTCQGGSGGLLATSSQFADYELVVKIRVSGETPTTGVQVRSPLQGHFTENGAVYVPVTGSKDAAGDWHTIEVTANGGDVTAKLDGNAVTLDGRARSHGYIAIQYHGHGGKVEVSEAKLKPINMNAIFNGEDLTGWNIIEGHASVFTVKDGGINIENGNGQIETANLYKDFVLQLDIISNGTELNSGVFYRGPVGIFWKGYESQVRNHWTDNRRNPYDFGTGGNYGNQPTRMVVSSDHEWFHKTIVVDGNHAAVWVNGYQTSDFTDTRPVSENSDGKAGYVPGPGTIHLQGHDPTTNLTFKNIEIQEYPQRGPRAGGRPEGAGGEAGHGERTGRGGRGRQAE
ncbi:MAG: DUF1080 domain-containing protein [Candidatus Hydrogenedentes bacterium]|nr:DUF1080 domain-containing protein [Candidatus Hydrogenedentota bacterium]